MRVLIDVPRMVGRAELVHPLPNDVELPVQVLHLDLRDQPPGGQESQRLERPRPAARKASR